MRFALFACVCALCGAGAAAAPIMTIVDSDGKLGTVDLLSGDVTVIGHTGQTLTDIAYDPDGNLFGVTASALYQISLDDASATFNAVHFESSINGLVFDDSGTLYASGNGFYTLDTDGVFPIRNDIKTSGVLSAGDLAFIGSDLLFSRLGFGGDDQLRRINPTNGSVSSSRGNLPDDSFFGLATPDNQTLYGVSGTVIYQLDPTDASVIDSFDYGGQGLGDGFGAAFFTEAGATMSGGAVVPLPAAGWLLLGGLGALSAVARRRAR